MAKSEGGETRVDTQNMRAADPIRSTTQEAQCVAELLSERAAHSRPDIHTADDGAHIPGFARDDGQRSNDTQSSRAVVQIPASAGGLVQSGTGAQTPRDETDTSHSVGADLQHAHDAQASDEVAVIVDLWRQRQDLLRARGRLDLQCQALCRRVCKGEKGEAGKLWKLIQGGKSDNPVGLVLIPYMSGLAPLDDRLHEIELQLAKLARKLPLWAVWGKNVRGLGALSFAGLIGEAGRPLRDYRSVSAIWKRFGLAVINGQRQRRVADTELALVHGYAPQRRAFAYVLSTSLMKSQRVATDEMQADPYRALYDARKSYELAREIPKAHAHNRAMRVMVKALLRDAWVLA